MAEYIDRELAIKAVMNEDKDVMADYGEEYGTEWGFSEEKIIGVIMKLPAADVAPVVHGTWLLRHIGHGHYWECSICHATPIYVTNNTNYCPECGAKMYEEQEEPTNGKQHDAE